MDLNLSRRACLAGMAALPFVPAVAQAGGVGQITRLDPGLDAVVDTSAAIVVVATGFRWAEGPVYDVRDDSLYFSDVPANICYRWTRDGGAKPFLAPSGLAGPIPEGVREGGSNGLILGPRNELLMADSGTRAIARVDLKTKAKTILADRFEGKRFNSCNDLVYHYKTQSLFFTDPPYGLEGGDDSPLKELDFNGVFALRPDGTVEALDRSLSRPNGVAIAPGGATLYVAMSDEKRPHVLAYPLDASGRVGKPRIFHDMSKWLKEGLPGLPDGIKTDNQGRVYATGPGGVHILSKTGTLLGIVSTGKAVANCNWGEDGATLFLTSSDMVARVRMKARGYVTMQTVPD